MNLKEVVSSSSKRVRIPSIKIFSPDGTFLDLTDSVIKVSSTELLSGLYPVKKKNNGLVVHKSYYSKKETSYRIKATTQYTPPGGGQRPSFQDLYYYNPGLYYSINCNPLILVL